MDAAMSNHLILKRVLRNLPYRDLMSCCDVDSDWRHLADPMICYYRVTMSVRNYEMLCRIELEHISGYNGVAVTHSNIDFQDLIEILKQCTSETMSIDLDITDAGHFQLNFSVYAPFLTKFGHRIHLFSYKSPGVAVRAQRYSDFLSLMPNLEILQTNDLYVAGTLPLAPDSKTPTLSQLRLLDFGESVNSKLWELIIACAPHVRKIQGFPLELVDLLPPFPNSGSDEFPSENKLGGNCQMEIIECSLRQVLDIPLKQTNFSIPNYYSLAGRISRAKEDSWYPGNSERFKRTQTSRNLETGIGKTWTSTRDHFFPPRFQMDANVEIGNKSVFTYIMENGRCPNPGAVVEDHLYSPPGSDLKRTCPILSGPDIKIKCHQRNNEPLFPLDTFGPKILGSGLKNPITRTPSVYKQLVILVQHATHNQLDLHSAMDLSSRIFPECSNGRPLLTSSEDYSRNYQMVYKNLDSVLTRNPAGHCCDIHQKIKRLRKILKAEVSTLQRQNTNKPSLVDMQHLNRLEIILEECRFQCDKCGKKHIFGGMILPWTVLAFQWLLLVDSLV